MLIAVKSMLNYEKGNPMNELPRIAKRSLLLLTIFILPSISFAQDVATRSPAKPDKVAAQAWATLVAIEQKIYEQHFSPATRQQLFLAATQAVYRSNRFSIQPELPAEFSEAKEYPEFKTLFLKAWQSASEKEAFDAEQSMVAAATGMLRSVGGTTSRFLSAKEYKIAQSLKENQYVGIGIQLGTDGDYAVIQKAFFGGAAQIAGAISNDQILEVDGVDMQGKKLNVVVDALRGPKNSTLDIKLRNGDNAQVREYQMTRTVIPIPTIEGVSRLDDGKWKLHVDSEPEIAILRFKSINGSTSAELAQLAKQIEKKGIEKIVMDFREVQIADVHHVVMLADALLDDQSLGTLISRAEGRQELSTRPGTLVSNDTKIAVLSSPQVNGAVFMLLANLKNRPNVTFVGNPVASSGLATQSFNLPNELGAIEDVPFGICVTAAADPFNPRHNAMFNDRSYIGQLRFQISTDVGAELAPGEYFQQALKVLKNESNVSTN